MLCQNKIRMKQMPNIMHRALYKRYCSSLNYFFTKDINRILEKVRSKPYIDYKELEYDKADEDNLMKFVHMDKFK